MAGQTLNATITVLDRVATGENWLRIAGFSAEHGMLDCLQRQARRSAATSPRLDLFEEARVALTTTNQGRTWFVGEVTSLRRRTDLGRSYRALQLACRFARVLAINPLHDDSRRAAMDLLHRALDAWETGIRPDAVYLKSLYLFARAEGYPVGEEWWLNLPAGDRTEVDSVLRRPATEQTCTEGEVARLTNALEQYLAHSTEMRFER